MSEPLSLTTELEAVNAILASVGESPIVEFDGAFVDAELARTLLTQEMRALQTHGWHWNTDLDTVFTPDDDGYIFLPTNILSMTFTDKNLVKRGQKIYDRSLKSYTFTDAITVPETVVLLPFDEMPEPARRFTYCKAGRRFQDRLNGDQVLHKIQANDEMVAWAALLNEAGQSEGWNLLDNSALMQRLRGAR